MIIPLNSKPYGSIYRFQFTQFLTYLEITGSYQSLVFIWNTVDKPLLVLSPPPILWSECFLGSESIVIIWIMATSFGKGHCSYHQIKASLLQYFSQSLFMRKLTETGPLLYQRKLGFKAGLLETHCGRPGGCFLLLFLFFKISNTSRIGIFRKQRKMTWKRHVKYKPHFIIRFNNQPSSRKDF